MQNRVVLKMKHYRLDLLVCLFLILTTFAVYLPLTGSDFINFDDKEYVTENLYVQEGFTQKSLSWAFSTVHANNWHPLTWLSHMLDCRLYGLNPGMHHLTNLLFHMVNSVLLFLLFRQMTGSLWPSAFVAALFAFHPLHVESVAWVSERKDMLGTFFWLLTMLAYSHYVKKSRLSRYLPVPFLFALGLLAKPMLVTLPCVLLLMDFWPLGRLQEGQGRGAGKSGVFFSLLWEKAPLFVLSAASCIVTLYAQKTGGLVRSLDLFPLDVRIGNALVSYVSYIAKMFWPLDLAFYYPHPGASLPMWKIAGAGLVLLGISVAVFRVKKKYPCLLAGWLWWLGTLVPVIGLVQVASQAMADRYTYIPFIGLFIMLAWGIPGLVGRWRHQRVVFSYLAAIILLGCIVGAGLQVRHWKNSITLFGHALEVTSNNYVANNSLGAALEAQGRLKEAFIYISEALRIKPDGEYAHYNLGVVLMRQGETARAIHHFSEAVRIVPDFSMAHYNLGMALREMGDIRKAHDHFSSAVQIKPDFAEAHNSLAAVLNGLGRHKEAVSHYKKALEIKPAYAEAHNNLGSILYSLGDHRTSAQHYITAIKIDPDFVEAYFNLGVALRKQGKQNEAFGNFSEALRINPDFAPAHFQMGVVLAGRGDLEGAVRYFRSTLRIKPDHGEAHNNLGSILARQGKFEEAVKHFTEALHLKPEYVDARRNLDLALKLMEKGRVNK